MPVVPGSDGPVADPKEAARVAAHIGYPVLLKAAAGGGGKGMRIVRRREGIRQRAGPHAWARRASAFGDASVFVEKYIEHPKHIEVQVLADDHGNVISYGERECSMQRRHQKVIEEAPSPVVDPTMRAALSEAAARPRRRRLPRRGHGGVHRRCAATTSTSWR